MGVSCSDDDPRGAGIGSSAKGVDRDGGRSVAEPPAWRSTTTPSSWLDIVPRNAMLTFSQKPLCGVALSEPGVFLSVLKEADGVIHATMQKHTVGNL